MYEKTDTWKMVEFYGQSVFHEYMAKKVYKYLVYVAIPT